MGILLRLSKVEIAVITITRKGIRLGLVAGLVVTGLVGVTSLTAAGTGAQPMVPYGTLTLTLSDRAGSLKLVRGSETLSQALTVQSPCSTLVAGNVVNSGAVPPTGNFLNFGAAVLNGSSPNVQLPSNGIGVTDGANCGGSAGLVGPGETLTLELGSFLPSDVKVSTGTLQIGKSRSNDGNLSVAYDGGNFGSAITVSPGVQPITVESAGGFRSISIRSDATQSSRGLSLRSNTVFTLMAPAEATAPGAPTGVTATGGNAQATVSWTEPANGGSPITGYQLQYSSNGGAWTPSAPLTATSGQPVLGLVNGTAYIFQVRAVNAVGESAWSQPSGPVTPATVPGLPTVTAVSGNAQATVSWTAPANGGSPITRYELQYYTTTAPNTKISVAVDPVLATTQIVSPLANGTAYIFEVRAVNAKGASAWAQSIAVTPATVPGPPTTVTAVSGNAQATVTWGIPASNGGSPITGYQLQYRPSNGTEWTDLPTPATSPQAVTGLTNNTAYIFEVRAVNAKGESAWAQSNPVTPILSLTLPVNCGGGVPLDGGPGDIADKVVFFRGENQNKSGDGVATECKEVSATVKIVSNDVTQPVGQRDYVFWDNTFTDVDGNIQGVNATVTIDWAPVPVADAVSLRRLIDYDGLTGDGPYRETLWCESFAEPIITIGPPRTVKYNAVLPDWSYAPSTGTQGSIMVDGKRKAPWCLVSDNRVQRDGFILQTEVLFGSGDPTRLGAR